MGAKEKMNDKYGFSWDFSGGPVVKTLPSNGGGVGSIPGWGTQVLHATKPTKQRVIKQRQYCNKVN